MKPMGKVVTRDGRGGKIVGSTEPGNGGGHMLVQMDDGRQVMVPAELLAQQEDGSYALPVDLSQLDVAAGALGSSAIVIPVLAEELEVRRRRVERGGVRVHKQVHERQVEVDEPGFAEEVQIDRVPVHRAVDEPPPVRYEGETMIVPLLEEVVVVEKRLMLREELRITRHRREIHNPQRITLSSEQATIDRLDKEPADADSPHPA